MDTMILSFSEYENDIQLVQTAENIWESKDPELIIETKGSEAFVSKNTIEEIEDFGFWDYIDSSNICFIEWPDKIADLLPQNQVITVDIKLSLNQCREFTFYY